MKPGPVREGSPRGSGHRQIFCRKPQGIHSVMYENCKSGRLDRLNYLTLDCLETLPFPRGRCA